MLAVDDCYAYWQRVDVRVPPATRAEVAFQERWFGIKSEPRIHTIMTDMIERFDAYPEAFAVLRTLRTVPAALRPFFCHLHTQLADPIYRRFTGEFLPARRDQGYTAIDRETVARWVDALEPSRWSPSTCLKFASNLLAAALGVGLVGGRRDPRPLTWVAVPEVILGYALYLLRGVTFEGTLTSNPYLRSLGVTSEAFSVVAARVPGIEFAELGGVTELTWRYPDLGAWAEQALGAGA